MLMGMHVWHHPPAMMQGNLVGWSNVDGGLALVIRLACKAVHRQYNLSASHRENRKRQEKLQCIFSRKLRSCTGLT